MLYTYNHNTLPIDLNMVGACQIFPCPFHVNFINVLSTIHYNFPCLLRWTALHGVSFHSLFVVSWLVLPGTVRDTVPGGTEYVRYKTEHRRWRLPCVLPGASRKRAEAPSICSLHCLDPYLVQSFVLVEKIWR
jgi:hypothetical protein